MATQIITHAAVESGCSGYIDHPSGYLTLSPRNRLFTLPRLPGFIAYREQGRHIACLAGVHGPRESRPALLDGLLEMAQEMRVGVVVVQVSGDQVGLFRSRGFQVNSMGATFALNLTSFSMAGSKKMKLRNKIKRAREQGVRVEEVGREIARDSLVFSQLGSVSDAWLAGKRKKELDFMIGEVGGPEVPERRIFAARDSSGRMCAFITYVPAYGRRPGYLHDLTRKLPDAPVGVMELCNAAAIDRFRQEGVEYLHFGFTPFVKCDATLAEDSRFVAWVIRMLERYGESVYPTRSQADYKLKWGPAVVEPEYLAVRPLSLRAIVDLMVLTRTV